MKKLLYIGNNFAELTNYLSAMETLTFMLKNEGYNVIKSSNKKSKVFRLLDMCWSIIKNFRNVDYILIDTFSTSNFYYALVTSQIARFFNLKYIPILHGGNLSSRIKKSPYFSKLLFKNSYLNVSPSNYLKRIFENNGYQTSYIPNAININEFQIKDKLKYNPKLLWVRAFDKTYNPQMAIKVVEILKKKYKNVELCMVGPDKDGSMDLCKKMATKLSVRENVFFTGVMPREKWIQLAENYDLFINTSNIDNLPVSIIEAMALGFPIISTNVGGIPFLISDKINGILVPENDAKAMATEIINLVEDSKKAVELGKNARKSAKQYDQKMVIKKWLEVLK